MFNEEDLLDEGFKERTSYELSKIPVKINSYKLKKAENELEELKKVKKELDDDDGNFDYIKSKKARENAKSKMAFKKEWVKDDAERLKNKIKINREKLNNSNKIYEDRKRKYELSTIRKEDTSMYYTEEELLEAIVEDYGVYEKDGELYIEHEMVDYVMKEFDLIQEDAIEVIMECYNNLLNEKFKFDRNSEGNQQHKSYQGKMRRIADVTLESDDDKEDRQFSGKFARRRALTRALANPSSNTSKHMRISDDEAKKIRKSVGGKRIKDLDKKIDAHNRNYDRYNGVPKSNKEQSKQEAPKHEEPKQEAPKHEEPKQEAPKHEEPKQKYPMSNVEQPKHEESSSQEEPKKRSINKKVVAGAVAGTAVAAGGAYLTHRAYKAHKAKKEAEAKRNKGLRGKLRRLREDYGIYEENGELFIESEMVEYVMSAYDLYEEDAIEVIVDCYNKGLDDEDLM